MRGNERLAKAGLNGIGGSYRYSHDMMGTERERKRMRRKDGREEGKDELIGRFING